MLFREIVYRKRPHTHTHTHTHKMREQNAQFYNVLSSRYKVRPKRGHESPEGLYEYSSILSLTSALDVVGG